MESPSWTGGTETMRYIQKDVTSCMFDVTLIMALYNNNLTLIGRSPVISVLNYK